MRKKEKEDEEKRKGRWERGWAEIANTHTHKYIYNTKRMEYIAFCLPRALVCKAMSPSRLFGAGSYIIVHPAAPSLPFLFTIY